MSTLPTRRLLSEPEYLLVERQAIEKSEYCRGEMYAMASATANHETIAGNCFGLLWQSLRKRGCAVYKSDMKVWIPAKGRYTYPDVIVACGDRRFADERQDVLLNPTILIEVLSESTAEYDLVQKSHDYRTLDSICELAFFAQDQAWAEHHVRDEEGAWTIRPLVGCNSSIDLKLIGCRLELSAVYDTIEFPPSPRPILRVTRDDAP